jgi:hypothetical protein
LITGQKFEVIPDKVHIIGNYEKKGDTEVFNLFGVLVDSS